MSITPASVGPSARRGTIADKELQVASGYLMLILGLALIVLSLWFASTGLRSDDFGFRFGLAGLGIVVAFVLLRGLVVLQPNESLVCLLFGNYVGTQHRSGFWWVNPFNTKKKVSRRLVTLECGPLKVNDAVGNPIDIGAVVVWRVDDAAKAVLEVASYENYVRAQSETALRRMSSAHPYDHVEAEEAAKGAETVAAGMQPAVGDEQKLISTVTLRDGGDAISESLLKEIRSRMEPIGIAVDEARISHLAYSSEIAGAMLRKQAASAVVAARRMVVKGAVSIVENALRELDEKNIGEGIDAERRAAMISNLLVVLVGDREAIPVINTGTLHT
jgi:regulator of protease activity HflC (stomatin/prohibitin superfamily)